MTKSTITVAWPPVPGATGYDLLENGRKVATTTATSARFSVGSGDQLAIVAHAAPTPPSTVTKTFTGPPGANIDAFLDSLVAGDIAGLNPGSYPFSSYQRKAHGTVDHPIVLTSVDPSRPAIIQGRFVTYAGDPATPAGDYWTLRLLGIDGSKTTDASAATIQSRGVRFELCDMSNFGTDKIGWIVQPTANGTTFDRCRIHDCGLLSPRGNMEHGIYDEGNGTHVVDCLIYRCQARGIQDRGGHASVYEYTTIADCGEGIIFGDDRGAVDCRASRLILANRQEPNRYLVEALGAANSGNTVDEFFAWNDDGGAEIQPGLAQLGVTVTNAHLQNPALDANWMPTNVAASGYGCRSLPPKILANA